MGNYKNTEEQYLIETYVYFEKIIKKKMIIKKDILALNNCFKRLKEEVPEVYKDMKKQANNLVNNAHDIMRLAGNNGQINPKDWERLQDLYTDFTTHYNAIAPKEIKNDPQKVKSLKKRIESYFASLLSMDSISKESIEYLQKDFEIIAQEDENPIFKDMLREIHKVLHPRSMSKRFRTQIPRSEIKHLYEVYFH